MGVTLSCSCFGQSSNHAQENLPNSSASGDKNCKLASLIINFMKPRCSGTRKGRPIEAQQEKDRKMPKRTLEDWLSEASSPTSKQSDIINADKHMFKHFSNKRIHPSSAYPRGSFSKERLLKVVEDGDSLEVISSSFKRISQGERIKKRVSFRLPEEDEIIIFTSPELIVAEDE
ncbi:hypothetical protein CDL15_Pgr012108 [Punica granatum]|uniref:Uncharacterized protein n=1 Tax=Punica granatum TaxID=22663 RepID=A0A218XM61_PUNGR|nr:hypothetical protein CDL15_Pgr012108 [Punica granatum]PKI77447.1 hypothetical protein CRG98_002053 [Punica granatum]